MKTPNATQQIGFPTPISEIHDLEGMDSKGIHPISFRVNVFREDPITKKLQLIRKSVFEDGKIINVLLTEFEHENSSYLHYILIGNCSFFKK